MTEAAARKRWTAVHWVGLAAAVALLGDSALYVVLPAHRESLGFTALQVGVLLSANRLVRIALNDPTARALDRLGLRAPLAFALLLAALTTLGYGHVGFIAFLVLRIVWGLSWSLIRNAANKAVLGEEPVRRGELQGSFRSLARVGSLAAVVGGAWLVGRAGFSRAYDVLGLLTIPGVLLVLGALRGGEAVATERRADDAPAPVRGTIAVTVAAFLVNAMGASLLLVTLGDGVHRAAVEQSRDIGPSALLFMSNPYWSSSYLGFAGAGRWIGEIAIAPLAGHFADRVGRRPVLVVSGLLAAGALGGCGTARSPEQFVAAAMFAFAMLSAFQTALDALATDRARSSTVALGRYFTIVDVGTAIGPLVGPALVEKIGFLNTAACSAVVVGLVAIAYMRRGSDTGADHARLHANG